MTGHIDEPAACAGQGENPSERHAGHADIVRELVDGTVGVRDGQPRGLWVSGSCG